MSADKNVPAIKVKEAPPSIQSPWMAYVDVAGGMRGFGFTQNDALTDLCVKLQAEVQRLADKVAGPDAEGLLKPQPMSDAEILACRQWSGDGASTMLNRLAFGRAVEARVNAQWAAMIGKPVATLVGYDNGERELRFDPNGWGHSHTPLYAITKDKT